MIAESESIFLARCRQRIEQQIGMGPSNSWTTANFERLSEAILSKTGVYLSVTTLKRVWGKIRYDSSPTTTTLNVLAQYLNYANWHDFKLVDTNESLPAPMPQAPSVGVPTERMVSPIRWTWGLLISVCLVGVFFLFGYDWHDSPLSPADFSFRSRPVSHGIPNSVVFDYDARSSPTDSIFIQQSWDARRRQLVSRNGRQHTSIYYHPGYYRAKLVIGRQVVAQHDLMIPSLGWHVAVLKEPVPVYIKAADVIRHGRLHLPVSLLQQYDIPLQPNPPVVRYRYIGELPGLRSDNFVLETRLRNEYNVGASICQHTRLLIHTKNKVFVLPLSAKGCVSELYLALAGHEVDGKKADLSAFGVDSGQWIEVRLEVIKKRARVLLNGQLAYEAVIPTAPVDLVGITYDFDGTGSVDYCKFSQVDGTVIFGDEFD